MSKITNFCKEVKARLTGDEAGVLAAKNERKAVSAINGQIASLKAKQVDDENAVEEAKESLKEAKYPTVLISNNQTYLQNIKNNQEKLNQVEESLQQTNENIAYYEALLKEFE